MTYNLKPDERASLELRGLYEKYGYKKYKMGKFEEYSLYASNSDFLSGDRVITFTDLDGRLLALKPDVTLSVMNNTDVTGNKTEKLYYIENVYRENRESHSFKEISQMGLEYLGNVTKQGILEVIVLAAQTLNEISEDNILEINNMDYGVHLMESLNLKESTYLKILNAIRHKNSAAIREYGSKAQVPENVLETLTKLPFLYGKPDDALMRAEKLALNDKMLEDVEKLRMYCNALKELGYEQNIRLDLSMINDIDYYNSITFRGYVRSLPGCVIAGGQYDKAMKVLGKEGNAIGFAVYLDELVKGHEVPPHYDVDAVLYYKEDDDMVKVTEAIATIQAEGKTVRGITSDEDILYKEKYVLRNGNPVKEVEEC